MASKPAKKQKLPNVTIYKWSGLNKRGEKVCGEINATSIGIAKAELRKHTIIVKRIRKKPQPLFGTREKKITSAHIATFTRQLATMTKAGIPIVTCLELLGKAQSNTSMQTMLLSIKADVETGLTLSQALRKHPNFFDDLYCNLIESGEQSGHLETMLDRLAIYREKAESMRRKVKKAVTYPIAIILIATIVTVVLLTYVVPQFEQIFSEFGADLPLITRIVVGISEALREYWWVFTLVFGGGGWFFFHLLRHSPAFRAKVDKHSLRLPILGDILTKSIIARFARTMAITVTAGMPITDAIQSASGSTGNSLYQKALIDVKSNVTSGQQLGWSLDLTRLFPSMVIQMVSIGEESGKLDDMLIKIAEFYEEEVDLMVDSLSSLLEPFIMLILGVLIGGLVVAMYMPIFQLGDVLK